MFRRFLMRPLIPLIRTSKRNLIETHFSNCWSCNRLLTEKQSKKFFCPCHLKKILPVNLSNNYFELFDLNVDYDVDKQKLKSKFRELMRQLHPDLFTLKSQVLI